MIPGSANPLLLASAAGSPAPSYQIERSLRFNSSDSAYCFRVFSSAGNRKTWTWAAWVKRGKLADSYIWGNNSTTAGIYFSFQGDKLNIGDYTSGVGFVFRLYTASVYRDPSAWMHIVFALDTTQATASNRARLYVNGVELTGGQLSTATYPTQNYDGYVNQAVQHNIGAITAAEGSKLDGYLADIHFIDGQALDPTSFGEFDANGVWQPKAYTGTYGTNGFHLDFADNSAATTAGIGKDVSGNGNDWTPVNLSVAAGANNDSLVDTPTSYGEDTGAGGEVRGNYCTLNPLRSATTHTLSEGNLRITGGGSSVYGTTAGTIGISSGKWYWEQTLTALVSADIQLGIGNSATLLANYIGATSRSYGFSSNNYKWNNGSNSSYTTGWVNGDVIGLAFDADAGSLTLYKNGVSLGTAFSGIPADTYFPMAAAYNSSSVSNLNFGQRPFAYPAPSGFKALCTTNLPEPLVAKPSEVMDVKLWTGNSGTQTISGLGFSPDLIWAKVRNATASNQLFDVIRGVNKALYSDSTSAEFTDTDAVTAFNSDGWTMGAEGGLNFNGNSYVAWAWDAGSSTVTNTQGSITSQVRANPSAGFSIVAYTGTGVNATVGHGLGVAPEFFIVKQRTNAGWSWNIYHISLGPTKVVRFTTDLPATVATIWNNTAPTSAVFSLGNANEINQSTSEYIAYCFASVAGYSAFGSYTGNGSADGPFVYTGFRPRFLLVKLSSGSVDNWFIQDTTRSPYNVSVNSLSPDNTNAESSGTYDSLDILSNGFKPRDTNQNLNGSGYTYIYFAIAEAPFQYARAR